MNATGFYSILSGMARRQSKLCGLSPSMSESVRIRRAFIESDTNDFKTQHKARDTKL